MKILIAMQNIIYAEYIAKHLEKMNHYVTICLDGKIALKYLEDDDWDLVILSLTLDYFHGFEVVDRFNKMNEDKHKRPYFMIISMMKNSKTVKVSAELGISDFLFLPLDTKFLLNKISQIEALCTN